MARKNKESKVCNSRLFRMQLNFVALFATYRPVNFCLFFSCLSHYLFLNQDTVIHLILHASYLIVIYP